MVEPIEQLTGGKDPGDWTCDKYYTEFPEVGDLVFFQHKQAWSLY
jgi:hypothetical protein